MQTRMIATVMAAERDDLGALFARVTRRLIAEERPLLDAHGMTMWEYVALSHLGRGAAGSQLAMAEAIGYDKTRLIALLEGLEDRDLVRREPDPQDRRARVVRLTHGGHAHPAGRAGRHPQDGAPRALGPVGR